MTTNLSKKQLIVLSLLSGTLLAIAFPVGLPFLIVKQGAIVSDTTIQEIFAWVFVVPLIVVLNNNNKPIASFLYAFTAGMGFFTILLYWINVAIHVFGGANIFISIAAHIILAALMALFWGLAGLLASLLNRKWNIPVVFSLPAVFTITEYSREFLITGFPWGNPSYSQYKMLSLIQISDIVGVYGFCFILLAVNSAIYLALFSKNHRVKSMGFVLLTAIVLIAYSIFAPGLFKPETSQKLSFSVIQANIDQDIKNMRISTGDIILKKFKDMTEEALKKTPDLIIWPEGAYPDFFIIGSETAPEPMYMQLNGSWLITGAASYNPSMNKVPDFRNSVYLIKPDGKTIAGRYDKTHLVPFGEYVPLRDYLPVEKLVPGGGIFLPGTSFMPMKMNKTQIGAMICYEGIFPVISRKIVKNGADLLINFTNDAWYGASSAPHQHLAMYAFRALETRRWLIRATNTGFSAVISPTGKIIRKSGLYTTEIMNDSVPIIKRKSIYTLIGDKPIIIVMLVILLGLILSFKKNR